MQVHALSLAQQVDYFTMARDRLVRQFGPSHLAKSLFPIVIGANDLFAYFTVGSLVAKLYTPQQYVDRMLSTFKGLLKMLYGLCVRKLAVPGVLAIGCCPMQRTNRAGECNVELNSTANKYNDEATRIEV
ncbi:putative triacylglycerol lipase [Helianthus debilis subsp. tardiflorus]